MHCFKMRIRFWWEFNNQKDILDNHLSNGCFKVLAKCEKIATFTLKVSFAFILTGQGCLVFDSLSINSS